MKKLLLLISTLPCLCIQAQVKNVTYPDVVKKFFKQYNFLPEQPVNGLNFAKKKNGWYVQKIDRLTENEKEGKIFFDNKTGWKKLQGFGRPLPPQDQEYEVFQYLAGYAGTYQFYGYERCKYYGYSGWDKDIIADYSGQPLAIMPDTLLESLGRAYSAYATRFLWYQFGGELNETDSLQKKLRPLEYPSARRIDSVKFYIGKAITCYAQLKARNPRYQTLVGNMGMKLFNEQMYGFNQLSMTGFDEEAKEFLSEIKPNETIIRIAKNYLNNCPPHAILFSSGDVDTYTLWYVQEAMNFRKDVSVINQSLLGFPIYIDGLRRTNLVKFAASKEIYGDATFQYSLFKEKADSEQQTASLSEFLKILYARQFKTEPDDNNEVRSTYPHKEISLAIDSTLFQFFPGQLRPGNDIKFILGDYVTLDQMMILDIINQNIYSRPVMFTYTNDMCSQYLQQVGLVYQLLPLTTEDVDANKAASVNAIGSYLNKDFQLVSSTDYSSGIAPAQNMDMAYFTLYGQVAEWHINNDEKEKAQEMLAYLKKSFSKLPPSVDSYAGYIFFLLGDKVSGLKIFENNAAFLYNLYKKPSALYPVITKESAKLGVTKLLMELKQMKIKSVKIEKINRLLK